MKKSRSGCSSPSCSRKTATLLLVTLIVLMVSCSSALYMPTVGQQTESASLEQMLEGRKLYVKKCGSCHALILPEKHTKPEWEHYLNEMQQKASIDNTEKEQILKYLTRGN